MSDTQPTNPPDTNDDEHCPKSKDGAGHCTHWWDEAPCCWCLAL